MLLVSIFFLFRTVEEKKNSLDFRADELTSISPPVIGWKTESSAWWRSGLGVRLVLTEPVCWASCSSYTAISQRERKSTISQLLLLIFLFLLFSTLQSLKVLIAINIFNVQCLTDNMHSTQGLHTDLQPHTLFTREVQSQQSIEQA